MDLKCPVTGKDIPPEDINFEKDLVYSRHCGKMFDLEQLLDLQISSDLTDGVLREQEPSGCCVERLAHGTLRLELKPRRLHGMPSLVIGLLGLAFGLGLTVAFANGAVSIPANSPTRTVEWLAFGLAIAAGYICGSGSLLLSIFLFFGCHRFTLGQASNRIEYLLGPVSIRSADVPFDARSCVNAGVSTWLTFNGQPMMTIRITTRTGTRVLRTLNFISRPEPIEYVVRVIREHIRNLDSP